MKKNLSSKQSAFTIIEMLVSISVLAIMTVFAVSNFRAGEKKIQLNMAANVLISDIRKVQNMVLNGAEWDGQTMPSFGYGMNFLEDSYIIFADNNGNKKYDLGELIKTVQLFNVSIAVDQYSNNDLTDMVFSPPKARACLNNNTCSPCDCNIKNEGIFNLILTHNRTNEQISISINQISGRVGIE
ncbi:MAG: prepilin-type N-terminal cleavage/methylation domain-containing protein [bacterium]